MRALKKVEGGKRLAEEERRAENKVAVNKMAEENQEKKAKRLQKSQRE